MLEISRHLLAFCVVCGAVGSYFISIYVLILAFVVCLFIFVIDYKFLGQSFSAIKDYDFPVPSWIKSIIASLMNSYNLSKPLEPELNPRRGSPFSPNVPIPRRPGCRTGRYTCLDENTDYANRKNGIGVCNPSPAFNNSYPNNLHAFRRRSVFSDSDNSSKIEEFATPQTSPWARRQNYSGNEFSNVRRVQTVAGPLLATSGLIKKKSNEFGLYVDANSPGLASRIVQYREEGVSSGGAVWTHQPQYNTPGQFPMVQLSPSPSSLPVLSPLSSQKASRRSVRVKIAPPDPLGSRLYPLSTKNNSSYLTTVQADHSTKSVLDTLKEISRKRIHSQLEDCDDDAVKRQKRSEPTDMLTALTNDNGNGENMSKRLREESPRQFELSPPSRPTKRICNNEILSSLSSSQKLLQGGGVKRKTQNLDWSRCSTPVLGKQQKTVNDDASPISLPKQQSANTPSTPSLAVISKDAPEESQGTSSQKSVKTSTETERRLVNSLPSGKLPGSGKEAQKKTSQVASVIPNVVQKGSSPENDSPWQKDSPFLRVSSPDDVIDDVSALEEKREEDRRSRLLSMMTVISGGEPPVKTTTTTADTAETRTGKEIFSLGSSNSSFVTPPATNSLVPNTSSTKSLFGSSVSSSLLNANSTVLTDSPVSTQSSSHTTNQSTVTIEKSFESVVSNNPVTISPMYTFGDASTPHRNTSQAETNSIDKQTTSMSPITSNSQIRIAPAFGLPSTSVSTQSLSSPVFGSSLSVFGTKPAVSTENTNLFNIQAQPSVNSTTSSTNSKTISLGFASNLNSQVAFGVEASSVASPTSVAESVVTAAATPVTSSFSIFPLHPTVSVHGQDNSASSSSSGFNSSSATTVIAAAPSGQTNALSKAINFGAAAKLPEAASGVSSSSGLFGAPNPSVATTSTTPCGFIFGGGGGGGAAAAGGGNGGGGAAAASTTNTTTTASSVTTTSAALSTSGLQMKPSLFTLGGASSVASPLSQTTATVSNPKSDFASATGGFGQQTQASTPTTANHSGNFQPATTKVGGFKFDLAPGKSPFSTQPSISSNSTVNVFGNPSATTTSSEPKLFSFGSAKLADNPFALSTSNNNSTTSQNENPVNLFGSPSLQQKMTNADKSKENLFSFGGNSAAASVFSTPQTGSFSAQPATTTTTTTANSGFSFPSAAVSGFSQPQSGTNGFSIQPVLSTATFASPATTTTSTLNSAFSFGSTTSNPSSQSNMFSFGASTSTSETQPGNPFAFGNSNTVAVTAGSGLFGQPAAAPVAAGQSQAVQVLVPSQPSNATAPAFQFGGSSSTPQLPGAFSFGSSGANPAGGFPSGGSFQMNTGGFGSGPAMFSIGSGSTAPRVRSSRTRRTK